MKKILFTLSLIAGLTAAFVAMPLSAQFIIIDDEEEDQEVESTFRILDYLSFEASSTHATGGVDRVLNLYDIGVKLDFLDGSVKVNAGLRKADTELTFTQVLKPYYEIEGTDRIPLEEYNVLPKERSASIEIEGDFDFKFDVVYQPSDLVTVTGGEFVPALGQFGYISVVSLLLPITQENTGASFDKESLHVPQFGAQLQYYPTSDIELSLFQSIGYEIDDVFAESVIANTAPNELTDAQRDSIDIDDILETPTALTFARALYQPSWGALGLTLFQGSDSFTSVNKDTYTCREQDTSISTDINDRESYIGGDCSLLHPNQFIGGDIGNIFLDRQFSEKAYIPEVQGVGFEIAYNAGRRTFIFETVSVETEVSTSSYLFEGSLIDTSNFFDPDPINTIHSASYWNYYLNGGKSAFPITRQQTSFGMESRSEDGTATLFLQLISFSFDYDAQYQPIVDSLENQGGFLQSFAAPSVLWLKDNRWFGVDATFSTGLGFFASYAGIFATQSIRITEHITGVAGINVVTNIGDESTAEENDTNEYEFETGANAGITAGLNISF